MKITEVDIFDVKLAPHVTDWNPVIIRINTDEGINGVGEVALAYGTGSAAGVGMVRNLAEQFLLGADPFRIEHLWDKMYRQTFWAQGGGPVVFGGMSAVDEALWDIKGKALEVPVYELLGGCCQEKIRVYASVCMGGECVESEEYAKEAERLVSEGYTALKFDPFTGDSRKGEERSPKRALDAERANLAYDRVKAVRNAVGSDVDIMVEAHGNLGTTSAIQMGKRLEEFNPFFFEEPVDALNVECMRKVAENGDIPIAAGERLYTRYGFRQYIEGQVIDILQPDVGLAGGITETKKIATHAETYNLHLQPHNCAGPVATAAAIQLDACMTNFIIQEWFPYHEEAHYRLVNQALEHQVVDGYLTISEAPGLGVELNDEVIDQYPCLQVR
ncbi:MAG: mandelate racemase/muconate lactonizing enzyme family protein [Chloroflexota bacterium]|nr:mandelate racemase/muconate lactonizing enzyme family protein [Chloroflexota bacterium]